MYLHVPAFMSASYVVPSLRWVHKSCNAEWLSQSKRATCEVSRLPDVCACQPS